VLAEILEGHGVTEKKSNEATRRSSQTIIQALNKAKQERKQANIKIITQATTITIDVPAKVNGVLQASVIFPSVKIALSFQLPNRRSTIFPFHFRG